MELTDEKKNLNYTRWIEKLKAYDCYSESLVNELGDKICNGTFNINEGNGGCYEGALVDIVLNNLCVMGYHINETAFGINAKNKKNHPFLCVSLPMLMRVLLLQHIAKAEMFVPQTEQWKKNKGYMFDFNGNMETQLKLGERSAFLCMKHGIKLSEFEYEAMVSIDKDEKEYNAHQNPLTILVKMVNQLVGIELQRKYDYYNTDKTVTKE